MLVPVVWFEESAMIPEEAARKFKSLYTDRIRMINIALTSLFLAALGLLAVDTRLLINQYWRCFNIKMNCKGSGALSTKSTGASSDHLKETLSSSSAASQRTDSNSLIMSSGKRVHRVRKAPDNGALIGSDLNGRGTATGYDEYDDDDDDDNDNDDDGGKSGAKNYAKRAFSGINLPLLASNIVASSNQQQQQVKSLTSAGGGNKSVEFAVHYNDTLLVDRNPVGQTLDEDSKADEIKSIVAIGSTDKNLQPIKRSATEVAQITPPSLTRQQ